MERDTKQQPEWDRREWSGSVTETPRESTPGDVASDEKARWNKTEWVGDQGEGAPLPVDPDEMPEGDTSISGRRHNPGEQHWADTDPAPDTERR